MLVERGPGNWLINTLSPDKKCLHLVGDVLKCIATMIYGQEARKRLYKTLCMIRQSRYPHHPVAICFFWICIIGSVVYLWSPYFSKILHWLLGPLLLTMLKFNPRLHQLYSVGWDYLPIPNFNGCNIEVWEWISDFIPHLSYWACNYLSMRGFQLKYVTKTGPWSIVMNN